jgi:hypothetical protein
MTLKELEDKWHYSRLSPLGKELWDTFAEGEWFYPSQNGYGDETIRTHIEHRKTKLRVAFSFKQEMVTPYGEHGPSFGFVLDKLEQKILLKRFRECVNTQLAFQFKIAPFKNDPPF